jgi:phage terminase large subunit-like protein
MTHAESGITIEIAPAKMDAMVGRRPLMLCVDELHLCATEVKSFASILDQARRGGQNWGGQYLELLISTAPPERSTGIWAETLDVARRVRDGSLPDNTFFPLLYEWPLSRADLDPEDATQWWRGMPSCTADGTMAPRELQREFEQVRLTSSARDMALLLSQRLGIEPNESRGANQTVMQELWPAAKAPDNPAAEPIAISLDPGGVSDPFAAVFGWRESGNICIRAKQYLSQKGYADASDNLRALYDKAVAAGELRIFATIEEMDAAVLEDLRFAYSKNMPIIGGDRYGRAGFVPRLENELIGPGKFLEVKQGWSLMRAHDGAEALLLDGKLRVVHSPLLDANVQNLRLEDGPNGRRFSKAETGMSGRGEHKTDGCMAALGCLEILLEHTSDDGSSNDLTWWIA